MYLQWILSADLIINQPNIMKTSLILPKYSLSTTFHFSFPDWSFICFSARVIIANTSTNETSVSLPFHAQFVSSRHELRTPFHGNFNRNISKDSVSFDCWCDYISLLIRSFILQNSVRKIVSEINPISFQQISFSTHS